jgi:hypothetical protein
MLRAQVVHPLAQEGRDEFSELRSRHKDPDESVDANRLPAGMYRLKAQRLTIQPSIRMGAEET